MQIAFVTVSFIQYDFFSTPHFTDFYSNLSLFFIISLTLKTLLIFCIHFFFNSALFSFLALTHKIFLACVWGALTLALILSHSLIQNQGPALLSSLQKDSQQITEKKAYLLRSFMIENMRSVSNFAAFLTPKLPKLNPNETAEFLQLILAQHNHFSSAGFYHTSQLFGIEIKNNKLSTLTSDVYHYHHWYRQTFSQPAPKNQNLFSHVFTPEFILEKNQLLVVLTAPVYFSNQIFGILKVNLPLDRIYSITQMGHADQFLVLDQQNRILFSQNFNQIGSSLSELSEQASQDAKKNFYHQVLAKGTASSFFSEGQTYYNAFSYILPDLNWTLIYFNPISTHLFNFKRLIIQTGLFSFAFLFLIWFFIFFAFKNLQKNFHWLMGQLTQHQQDNPVPEALPVNICLDDLGELLLQFSTHYWQIQDKVQKLNTIKNSSLTQLTALSASLDKLKTLHQQQTGYLEKELHFTQEISLQIKSSELSLKNAETELKDFFYLNRENYSSLESTKVLVEEILKNSKKIAEISDMIGEIVSQTNLLALNASVEAARAGTAGKGFGAISLEIRKLAVETSHSAFFINDIIPDNLNKIEQMVLVLKNWESSFENLLLRLETFQSTLRKISACTKEQHSDVIAIKQIIAQIYQSDFQALFNQIHEKFDHLKQLLK